MHYCVHVELHLLLKSLLSVRMKNSMQYENWIAHWLTALIECLSELSIKRYEQNIIMVYQCSGINP